MQVHTLLGWGHWRRVTCSVREFQRDNARSPVVAELFDERPDQSVVFTLLESLPIDILNSQLLANFVGS
jgi:hypothetical protein